ncbi:hypothetical protein SAMN06265374_2140 [Roseibium denhamense]|uniref:Uncharacterized protein n=1 Tax=Roseibium denhamense TaxID=76305 RepID=A0ABY1NY39_9HYPH|nr:hypothetical protein SAMN06265374_2140 [Roseibium denhamense]
MSAFDPMDPNLLPCLFCFRSFFSIAAKVRNPLIPGEDFLATADIARGLIQWRLRARILVVCCIEP